MICVLFVDFQLQLNEEDDMGITSTQDNNGAASPLTARSMRLERVAQALAHSQEELRRFVGFIIALECFICFKLNQMFFLYNMLDVLALILFHHH